VCVGVSLCVCVCVCVSVSVCVNMCEWSGRRRNECAARCCCSAPCTQGIFIRAALFKRPFSSTISLLPSVLNLTFKTHGHFLWCVQMQPREAGDRLPETCTIRIASSMRVVQARLHLIWLLLLASGAYLLRHCT